MSSNFDISLDDAMDRFTIEAFDFDMETTPPVRMNDIIYKFQEVRPDLIMFFDEFSQWNVAAVKAIKKETFTKDYQILSFPSLKEIN